jgi:GAF domain-containing protein
LGTEVGLLAHRDETGTFELLYADAAADAPVEEGDHPPPARRLACSEVVRTEQTLAIRDVEEQAPDLLGSSGIETYIGAPVEVDGETFGTFCFFSSEAGPEGFDDWEVTYVDLFSD